jgi:hypothetical protein
MDMRDMTTRDARLPQITSANLASCAVDVSLEFVDDNGTHFPGIGFRPTRPDEASVGLNGIPAAALQALYNHIASNPEAASNTLVAEWIELFEKEAHQLDQRRADAAAAVADLAGLLARVAVQNYGAIAPDGTSMVEPSE